MFSGFFSRNFNSSNSKETEVNSVKEIAASVETIDIDEGFEEIDISETEERFFECKETQEELEALNSSLDSQSQNRTISYALEPLLYVAKYGAKVLSATTVVASYTLDGASYVMAGMSYIPHGTSKVLEKIKAEKDKDAVEYKIITTSQHLLDLTSGAIYTASYIPYGAGKVLYKISDAADWVDSSLSPKKVEQICTESDLFIESLSSKLKEIRTESFLQATLAIA
ncbi:hypothetical protein [Wolbachia endosymbiont of Ctenocephalides felis wCfeJ]|uniref:hypothetical protein n=1 Tax=Wolbachia endosymbiont of Ctenocephalides felis wCfeJ TaxID=2732594 RepID=UPI0014457750|nr:hypothetical protein [Wolbachia endosymbiont of Ctenocephalides felis wCfeJ]WCR57803.1 MAG: hypothetical protein PG980_000275 [Wolbachia endosymbiont of Ctenocephalides felis wCfeJ]